MAALGPDAVFRQSSLNHAELFLGGIGHEPRREDLSEHGVVAAPADAHQLGNRAILARALRVVAPGPALRVRAIEDQTRHAFRMPCDVTEALGASLRDAEQRERFAAARRIDDRFQIGELPLG